MTDIPLRGRNRYYLQSTGPGDRGRKRESTTEKESVTAGERLHRLAQQLRIKHKFTVHFGIPHANVLPFPSPIAPDQGPIPDSLCSLLQLTVVCLDGNALSGDLPSGLGTLRKLTVLAVQGNVLSGEWIKRKRVTPGREGLHLPVLIQTRENIILMFASHFLDADCSILHRPRSPSTYICTVEPVRGQYAQHLIVSTNGCHCRPRS